LVIATREEPNLPLARWRSLERVSEIDLEELRFSFDEAVLFLRETMGLELDAESARSLEMRTEGWIAGLQMAALSLQHHVRTGRADDLAQFVATFGGGHRYVIDYLAAEVLRRQPEEIHAFLRQTAILGRLCTSLCDAVTERTDSRAVLTRLERANMFLLRLDDERRWYRYHPFFADFLRRRLPAREARALHQKASAWYEDRHLREEAMKHALAAEDIPAAIRLFRAEVENTLSRGEAPTLLAWLEALPDSAVRAHGDLAGHKAWLLYLRGQTADAQAYAELARVVEHVDAPPDIVGCCSRSKLI
jgi:LuxR family maltose regulon positive regulatory protein